MPKIAQQFSMWFDWPDDPYKGRMEVIHLRSGETTTIKDQVVKFRDVYDPELKMPVSERLVNMTLDRQLTVVASVPAWENFVDKDGNPMECTEENKKIWAMDDEFMAFLNECRVKVAKAFREKKEKKEKN